MTDGSAKATRTFRETRPPAERRSRTRDEITVGHRTCSGLHAQRLASLHLHETEWIMLSMESCKLAVRLIPRARINEIAGDRDGVLLVRVTAPPVDGKANAALCRLIAKRAGVGVRSVSVVRGAGSRDKLVHVDGISAEDLRRALT